MLEVKDLSFSYGSRRVLDQVSFTACTGEVIAVLGANGAGKSTLFKCILGLLKPSSGNIFLSGKDIRKLTRAEIAEKAAYIPQTETPVFNYTVFDSVLMGTTGTLSPLKIPGEKQKNRTAKALEMMSISYLKDRGINEISGGERQLAFLARALAQGSRLLLMDEPTANLDYGNQQMVMNRVRKLAEQEYTILLSTHNPEHALQYADRVLVVKDQRIFAYGRTGEVLTESLIRKVYGIDVVITEAEVGGKKINSCIPIPTPEPAIPEAVKRYDQGQ